MRDFDRNHWALILGGSSGFGLATADKLSRHGMNIAVVHRDRKGAMGTIQPAFDAIAARGVGFRSWNVDALAAAERERVLAELAEAMGPDGRVRMLMHSIAFGNLKAFAPPPPPDGKPLERLAAALGLDAERVRAAVNALFAEGEPALAPLVPGGVGGDNLLGDEDWAFTVHAMGTSLATWVKAVLEGRLFADDARVLAMTSEGNRLAWRGYAAVSAAKCALESVARSIALECAPFGIRSNVIQAGVTNTPALRLIPGNRQMMASAVLRNPFRRATTPADVAAFICLLCTDEAAWVNGDVICVDGGEHLGG